MWSYTLRGRPSQGVCRGRRRANLHSAEMEMRASRGAHAFSASAKSKIEAKGGTCEVIQVKRPAPRLPKKERPSKAPKAKA